MAKHIDALTGVRAIAVMTVFFAHVLQRYFTYPELVGNRIQLAPFFGMTIFFVLSGFVIHWNYATLFATERPAVAGWKFFAARFSRLWPLHFAVTLLAQIWEPDLTRFIEHVFMVQTWTFFGVENTSYYNTWSISTEWFFYFAYALFYPLTARLKNRGSMWLLVAAFVVSFAIVWSVGPYAGEGDAWLRYYAPYLRVLEFFTGVVAAHLVMTWRTQERRMPGDATLMLAFVLTLVLSMTYLGRMAVMSYFLAPFIAVTLLVASNPQTITSRALSMKPLLWIGDRSYSIYLLEAVYLSFCQRLEGVFGYAYAASRPYSLNDAFAGLSLSILAVTIVFLLSDVSWRLFEMPARRFVIRVFTGAPAIQKPATP